MTDIIDTNKIKKDLATYKKSHPFIESLLDNEDDKKEMLKRIFIDNLTFSIDDNIELKAFKTYLFGDVEIIEYNEENLSNKKNKKFTIIVKNGKPVIKIIEEVETGLTTKIVTNTFATYDNDKHHLDNKIINKRILNGFDEVILENITLLGKTKGEYYKKDYQYIYQGNLVRAIKVGEDYYIKGNEGFDNRLEVSQKMVNKHTNAFITEWEGLTTKEPKTKEYTIKHK